MYLTLGLACVFIFTSNFNASTGVEGSEITTENINKRFNKSNTITTRSTEEYTSAEKNALAKFRPQVQNINLKDEDKMDWSLMRWLRARDLNVANALDMLRAAQKWRKDFNIDTIGNETIFDFATPPFYFDGFDREGNPILILTPTGFDLRRFAFQGQGDKLYRYIMQAAERAVARRAEGSRIFGKEIRQIDCIFDFQGFNLRQHACLACIPVFRDVFTSIENYYPDVIKNFIAINVPRVALPLIELMKALLSQSTLKALKVFPPDRKEWSKYLTEIIAPDQLPYRFGGTRKDTVLGSN